MTYVIGTSPVDEDQPVADIPWQGHAIRIRLKEVAPRKYLFVPVADKYLQMRDAAAAAGITFKLNTAFRDIVWQGRLWSAYLARGVAIGLDLKVTPYKSLSASQQAAVKPVTASPGTSDHERAIAVDIDTQGKDHNSPTYKWLAVNAITYGFKNDVPSESWHWSHKYAFTDADTVVGGRSIRFDNDGSLSAESTAHGVVVEAVKDTVQEAFSGKGPGGILPVLGLTAAAIGGWWLARPYLPTWVGGKKVASWP
jgi:hypothetical protein